MRVNSIALILSFCIGICVMLCLVPKPAVVIKFPRPDTGNDEYTAPDGTCFKVSARRVDCKGNAGSVLPQPVTEYESSKDPGLAFNNPFVKPGHST